MRDKRFEETRLGHHVCHQRYVRADNRWTLLTRTCEVFV